MARRRVYLQPFLPNGTYSGNWIEVTQDLVASSLGAIQRQLDVSEYDVGVYTNSSLSFTLRNDHGIYSDVGNVNSIFSYKRSDTLIKITWDMADWDFFAGASNSNEILGHEVIIYQGLLSDDATVMQLVDQTIAFDMLGYESILERAQAPDWVGTPPADNKCSTLIKALLAQANGAITQPVLTIDNTLITPNNDVTFDDLTKFANKTCKEALNSILQASNSILYIPTVTPIVKGRVASVLSQFSFYGPASSLGPENIVDIQDVRTGVNRTFNFVTWTSTALLSQDASSITTYGVRKKDLAIDGITNGTTQQSILDSLRAEFSNPKQEFLLIAPLTYAALALSLLDQVTIDFPLIPVTGTGYGIAQYGADSYAAVISSFQILTSEPYKIIGTSIDAVQNLITFNLRRI